MITSHSSKCMWDWAEGRSDKERVASAINQFPTEFRLRGHDGKFRISYENSYINQPGPAGQLFLYTQRWNEDESKWEDFAKGSFEELKIEVITLRHQMEDQLYD